MKIYLMRHGTPVAMDKDSERPLSDKGRHDVEKVAELLRKSGVKIDQALHSGKARARQTAAIMASRLNPGLVPVEIPGLAPMDDVTGIAEQVKEAEKDLLIAGHLPHLGKLISLLVAGDPSVHMVNFQQGTIVCLERDEIDRWSVTWVLVPEIL